MTAGDRLQTAHQSQREHRGRPPGTHPGAAGTRGTAATCGEVTASLRGGRQGPGGVMAQPETAEPSGGGVWVLLARPLGAGLGLTLLPSPLLPGVRFEPRRREASRGAQLQAVTCLSPKRRSCCLPSGADLEISAQAEPPGRQSSSELCSSKPRTRFSPQRRRLRGCLLLQRIYRLLAPSLPAPR